MKIGYFDCACGASGDMVVGALLDAGAPFDAIRQGLDSLSVPGLAVSACKVVKHGLSATQFTVHADEGHHHPHRRLADILAIIESGGLPEPVQRAAASTFQRIAECEAAVHGVPVDSVHFHEIGALDSIADIVAAHLGLHLLGIEEVAASPLNLGSGTVTTAHGVLPVPAPATVRLLAGAPGYGSAVPFELVTPTGAALITQWARAFGPMPEMVVETVGYGSGVRDLPDRADVLRLVVGAAASAMPDTEPVSIIEANIDDMNPELLPPLISELLARGARDAFLTPLVGKKGRPAFLVTVLCDPARTAEFTRMLFEETTTLGVRLRNERRVCLAREWKQAGTPWGPVRIKIGRYQGEVTSASPEFEDCQAAARRHNVPVLRVYDAARAAAARGELEDA